MAVEIVSSVAGLVSSGNPAINVTFPGSQTISISGPEDTITPVDDNGDYVALATAANQATANASLASIDSKLTTVAVTGPLTDAQLRASAVAVDGSGVTQPVSAASLPLPSGASTGAKQDTGNTSLSSIDTKFTTLNAKDFATQTTLAAVLTELGQKTEPTDTQPISAASLPLPSGAATGAKQDTGNASLSSMDTKLSTINTTLGSPFQAGGSIGNTSFIATQGTATNLKTQAENYQAGSAVGAANPLQVTLANTGANAIAVKVDGSAVTQPVSGTFWQTTQPVSAASLPLPTGASTLSEQQTQTTSLQLLDDAVATTGSAIPAKGIAVSGTDGTNARILKTDSSGRVILSAATGSGSFTAPLQQIFIDCTGYSTLTVQLSGNGVGLANYLCLFQQSLDGLFYTDISAMLKGHNIGSRAACTGLYSIDVSGMHTVSILSAVNSGTTTVNYQLSSAPIAVYDQSVNSNFIYAYNIPSQVHVASANTVHWDLFNADVNRVIRILSIRQIPNITTAVTGIVFDWKLARTTSVGTGGVAQTAWQPDTLDDALDADVTCRSKPAGGAAEGTILFNYSLSSEETNAATIQIASQGGLELIPPALALISKQGGIVLRKNEGLRCVQITNSNAGNTGWVIVFTME